MLWITAYKASIGNVVELLAKKCKFSVKPKRQDEVTFKMLAVGVLDQLNGCVSHCFQQA